MARELTTVQKALLVFFMAALLAGGGLRLYYSSDYFNGRTKDNPALSVTRREPARMLAVDVGGAVRRPGLYRLADGASMNDAVQKAGGALRNADTSGVNLAEKVSDREKIQIPFTGAAPVADTSIAQPAVAQEEREDPAPRAASGGASVADTRSSGEPAGGQKRQAGERDAKKPHVVNINKASETELQCLPGIGPAYAKRVVDLRKQRGPFKTIEEIMLVSGIGEKKFEKIKMYLKVN